MIIIPKWRILSEQSYRINHAHLLSRGLRVALFPGLGEFGPDNLSVTYPNGLLSRVPIGKKLAASISYPQTAPGPWLIDDSRMMPMSAPLTVLSVFQLDSISSSNWNGVSLFTSRIDSEQAGPWIHLSRTPPFTDDYQIHLFGYSDKYWVVGGWGTDDIIEIGRKYAACVRFESAAVDIALNGSIVSKTISSPYGPYDPSAWSASKKITGMWSAGCDGSVKQHNLLVWDRALSDEEMRIISADPDCVFAKPTSYMFVGVGGGGADVTTSGSIGSLSLSAATGAATGSATTSGSIGSISLSAATGSATASVSATADIKAVSLSSFTGSATGSATATGAIDTVSLTAATGTASTAGDVTTDGAIAALSLSGATGAATGAAAASGALAAVSLGAATGTATVSISVAGSLPVISLTAATGAASTGGDVVASAGLPALSLSAPIGASTGTATTSAALAPISLSAATGTASAGADVSASGSIAVIGLTAPLGTAAISIEAQAAIAAVFMSVPTGVATGSAACLGAMSAISLSACRATASNGLENLEFLRQSVFVRSSEAREFARINTSSRYFSRRN